MQANKQDAKFKRSSASCVVGQMASSRESPTRGHGSTPGDATLLIFFK